VRTNEFLAALRGLRFDNVFNPYSDRCDVYDLSDAPDRRVIALQAILKAAASADVDSLWIGRDLGYRGGRRTGLALTDDKHLTTHATRWKIPIQRATKGAIVAERTAGVIWSMLALVTVPVFLWNVFPLHPHEPNNPFSNRSHKPHERSAGEELLWELIALLRPRKLVAIGNDAAKTAFRLSSTAEVVKIRHPSYGGQREFVDQIQALYGLEIDSECRRLL
jgi:hypothetical protein